jgi:extracellular elastinolytic metalloproteinase
LLYSFVLILRYKTPAKKGKKKDTQTTYLDILTGEHVPREERKRGKIHGNTLMLQLVIDGMKLQPCRPSFVDARDAILQADKQGFKGRHQCLLWKGFAKRGLGYGAKSGGRESFEVPHKCRKEVDDEL